MLRPVINTRSFRVVLELTIIGVSGIVIVALALLINQTTELICDNDGARAFLEKIRSVPLEGWKIPLVALTLLGIMVAGFLLRSRLGQRPILQMILSLVDIACCIGIIAVLDFSYRGIIFIAIINAVRFLPGWRLKLGIIGLCTLAYVLVDFDIVAMRFPVFSITDYLDVYQDSRRFLFYGTRNLLVSLNEILFILFMVLEIKDWNEEHGKIRELNQRLLKTSEELQLTNVRLEEYARRSDQAARIRERNRLAREIHDILGHALTGIELGLKACLEIFTHDPGRVKTQLEKISVLARSGVEDVRRSVHELKADSDEGGNFLEALELLVAGIDGCTGSHIKLFVEGEAIGLPALAEEALYRAAQESLTNAIGHGEADLVELSVGFNPETVELAVRDNGKGCAKIVPGFGLQHMRERAESLGGQVLFTNLEHGFLVRISLPLRSVS